MSAAGNPPAGSNRKPDPPTTTSSTQHAAGSSTLARRSLLIGVVGLHVGVLAGALVVPCHAIVVAIAAIGRGDSLSDLVAADRWLHLLGNTAIVCGTALLTALTVGLVVGILLARTDIPGKRILAALTVLGACVPVYVAAVFIFAYLPASRLTEQTWACGLLYGLMLSPLAAVVLAAALRTADRELEDLARLDAGSIAVLLRVTIPQAGWGILALGILVFLLVGTDFTLTDLLFVRTFAEEVYTQYALDRSAAGPMLTSLPLLVTLALLFVYVQLRYRLFGEHALWQFGAPPRTLSLGRWRWLAAGGFIGVLLLLVGRPALSLLSKLRLFGSFDALCHSAGVLGQELLATTAFAAAGATIVVLFSAGFAWILLRGVRLRLPIVAAVVLLLALPAPVAGISMQGLLNRPGVLGALCDSPMIIAAGYVVRFLPIGVLLLLLAVQRVPREVESAARLDGCDWLSMQWHVYWPAIAADAAIAWLVIVILSFAEVGATKLIAPPGWHTASVRAFTLMHGGVDSNLALLALLSMCVILVLWVSLLCLLRRTGRWVQLAEDIRARGVK